MTSARIAWVALAALATATASLATEPGTSRVAAQDRLDLANATGDHEKTLAFACGRAVRRDFGEAAHWFRRAAEKGHAPAQRALGWMLMNGQGVARNDDEAAVWLRRAAEQGNVPAQNNLGVLYATGQGVAHDHAVAERWFRAAAEQGAHDAQHNLDVLLKQNTPAPSRPAGTM